MLEGNGQLRLADGARRREVIGPAGLERLHSRPGTLHAHVHELVGELDESRLGRVPVFQNPRCLRTTGEVNVAFDEGTHQVDILVRCQRLQVYASPVAAAGGGVAPGGVDKKGDPATAKTG